MREIEREESGERDERERVVMEKEKEMKGQERGTHTQREKNTFALQFLNK